MDLVTGLASGGTLINSDADDHCLRGRFVFMLISADGSAAKLYGW